MATVLLSLLPISPKVGDVPAALKTEYAKIKADVLHQALRLILQPLKSVPDNGIKMVCVDLK